RQASLALLTFAPARGAGKPFAVRRQGGAPHTARRRMLKQARPLARRHVPRCEAAGWACLAIVVHMADNQRHAVGRKREAVAVSDIAWQGRAFRALGDIPELDLALDIRKT